MCGIVGTINIPFDNTLLNLIKHRGPDDGDILNVPLKQNKIVLGHRRLSIQDLSSAGRQPMYSACGNFVIIFNGEIYNHFELREKLSNVVFKGHSDTETIVNYIAKYGIESVKDFNGIFALSLLDIEQQKLYLIRDRYGVKPLYFYKQSDQFCYASELRPIKELMNTTIDAQNMATLLKLRYNPAPTTLYKDINKLQAGHIVEYDLKTHNLEITSFIEPVKINKQIDFETALQQYGKLFEASVKRQLLSDVEIAVLLSGGIDSALVAYYAQKFSDKPIKTFTIGFRENDESDETIDARETARILGTEHYEINITDDEFEDIFEECIDIVEEPLGTTSIIPMYYLNKLVQIHDIKVVLTGQGADEPLGGYGRYKGEKMLSNTPNFLFDLAKPFSRFIKQENIYRALNALGEKDITKRWKQIYSLFDDTEIKKLIRTDEVKSEELIRYFYNLLDGKNKESTNAMMSNDIRMNLCDDLLLYTDKISMNFSIETRVPMLDNELVDFLESLPLEYKINGGEGKYIHKKFAESVLPQEIIYRKKKGFTSPTEKWFKGEKGFKYQKMLMREDTKFSKLFDLNEIDKLFQIHRKGERNMEKQIFLLISIYYWLKNIDSKVINNYKINAFQSKEDFLNYIVDKKKILVAMNAEKILKDDQKLVDIVNNNIGYPDGVGAVMALKQKGLESIKIPGSEFWLDIVKKFHRHKKFYLVGSTTKVIESTVKRLQEEYPFIEIVGYRNGFFEEGDKERLIEEIQFKKPDIVFVAQGSPKQEFLMNELIGQHPALYMGLGGSFDIYGGDKKRAPSFFLDLELEWFYRLIQEPTRIGRQLALMKFFIFIKKNASRYQSIS